MSRNLNFQAPPRLAIAEGATTPNPGPGEGYSAWSTTLGKPVHWTGAMWTAGTGGGGGGGSAEVHTLEIDFGQKVRVKTFDLALPAASLGQSVIASASLDMPAGVAQDELEMDPITCSAAVQAPGVVRLIASAKSPISGKRNINLILG